MVHPIDTTNIIEFFCFIRFTIFTANCLLHTAHCCIYLLHERIRTIAGTVGHYNIYLTYSNIKELIYKTITVIHLQKPHYGKQQ